MTVRDDCVRRSSTKSAIGGHHGGREPNFPWQELVHLYEGAAAGVLRCLRCMPERDDSALESEPYDSTQAFGCCRRSGSEPEAALLNTSRATTSTGRVVGLANGSGAENTDIRFG